MNKIYIGVSGFARSGKNLLEEITYKAMSIVYSKTFHIILKKFQIK